MRRILKFCVLLVLTTGIGIFAQEYKPVIKPDTSIWYFAHKQLAGNNIDTILAGQQIEDTIELWYSGAFYSGEKIKIGAYRQSTNSEKIWFRPSNETTELLIYDISLNEGDEFQFNWSPTPTVVSSIYYIDDTKIVEFNSNTDWGEPVRFIEGIGPNITLAWASDDPGFLSPLIVCAFSLDIKIYESSNESFQDCSLITSINTLEQISTINISPNPVVDHIKLEFNEPELLRNASIVIYSITGDIAHHQYCTGCQSVIIQTSHLSPGMYILKIQSRNFQETLKLIKK